MKGLALLKRLRDALVYDRHRISYAQCGEDIILRFLFELLGVAHPTYLDVGAHHPTHLSNTYLFYKGGSHGVCVEPNPALHALIQKRRPRDTCLNVGVGFGEARKLRFYILDDPTLSTFSEEVVREQTDKGLQVVSESEVALEPVRAIVEKHFPLCPNLVSLDTEGLDLEILQSWDFESHRAEVFCVETLTNVGEQKIVPILEFMAARNYVVFADTFVNTIFVEGTLLPARHSRLARTES